MNGRWLVAHDGTALSEPVLAEAAARAGAHGVGLRVVHALARNRLREDLDWSDGPSAPLTFDDYVADARHEAEASLAAARAQVLVHHPGLDVETLVVPGEPAEAILSAGAPPEILRIVMGTHARRGLRHWMLGSVAEAVIARAPVPVLIVPPHGAGVRNHGE
ncbi:MAG: universal stress protein [Deltaproteobacteria bacterium]|nr:universal stress protein [Deltaproteobacteria bacterium]MCB9789313.1 universal stress protein [Deltaproteobacteria bacterium]